MRVKLILSCYIILVILTQVGCKNNQSDKEKMGNDNNMNLNIDSKTGFNNRANEDEIDTSIQDNSSKTSDDFPEDEIKEFLLNADSQANKIIEEEYTSTERIIGQYDNTDVVEIIGEFDTYDKVKQLLGDSYTDEVIEIELNRRYLANIFGKIGEVAASGENFYYISEESQINLLVDEENKKVVEMDAFNDYDEVSKVEYTLEKQNSGKWIITNEKGYLNTNIKAIEKQLYYYDFSLKTSSQLSDYSPTYAMDEKLQTAWGEGVDGSGIGEWLEFESIGDHEITGIKIINGYAKSEDLYYKNNRIKKIRIEFQDNTVIDKVLDDGILEYQTVDFGKVVNVNYIKIIILEVYPGSKYNDTCISEIRVYR